jgi:hypothetical protein
MLSVPVTGTGTLREWLMNGRAGQDLTIPANRDGEASGKGTPIVGHIHATASDATNAGFDWIGVPYQFSSVRYFVGTPTAGLLESSQVPSLSTSFSDAQQGYMVFVRGDRKLVFPSVASSGSTKLRTVGELKKGDQAVSVSPASTSKYSIVGNPYMSVLDLDAFYNDNSSVIKPTFLLWDANIPGALKQGAYVTLTKSGSSWVTNIGTHVDPQLLESGMAFLVEPVIGLSSPANVTIRESQKSNRKAAGMMPFSNDASDAHGRMFVRLERVEANGGRGIVDGVLADFHDSHSDVLGDPTDIEKLRNVISQGALWFSTGGRTLSVEGLPWPKGETRRVLPLHMGRMDRQSLVLSIDPDNLRRPGLKAWLRDRHLGKNMEIDLSGVNDYAFVTTGNTSTDSLRFEIVFGKLPAAEAKSLRASAARVRDFVEIRWEMPDDGEVFYEVQRSADRENFITLNAMKADPAGLGSHRWTDTRPLDETGHYRVMATLPGGQVRYSELLRVDMGPVSEKWMIYPNPVDGGTVRLKLNDVYPGRYRMVMTDATGRSLTDAWIDHPGGDAEYPVNVPIPMKPGSYFIQVANEGRPVATLRMMRR